MTQARWFSRFAKWASRQTGRPLSFTIAVVVIIISGIMMMYSRGDQAVFGKAKKMLLWAVAGLAVILIGEGFTKLIESIINLKNR